MSDIHDEIKQINDGINQMERKMDLIERRQYKFLPDLATWLVFLYREGNIKKAKRIAKVILKYNFELNYDYLNEDYEKHENSMVVTPNSRRVLMWK